MSATHERCTGCGAKFAAETGECAYCGSHSGLDVPTPAPHRVSERLDRFDRVVQHADFDRWMRHRPAPSRSSDDFESGRFLAIGGATLAVAVLLLRFSGALDDTKLPIALALPLGLGALVLGSVGLLMMMKVPARSSRVEPVRAYPALVVSKRTLVSNSGYGRSSLTESAYFATLEFRTGTRREYGVDEAFYAVAAEDDIGLAYIREGVFESFKRFDA